MKNFIKISMIYNTKTKLKSLKTDYIGLFFYLNISASSGNISSHFLFISSFSSSLFLSYLSAIGSAVGLNFLSTSFWLKSKSCLL